MESKLLALLFILACFTSIMPISMFEPAKAQGIISFAPEALPTNHAYIRSNGDIDPPTLPIQRSGDAYQLTANIVNCTIDIQKSNVEIDGNAFSIYIPFYGERGADGQVKSVQSLMTISNQTNVTVKNFVLRDSGVAIYADNCSSLYIVNNTITDCKWIYLHFCNYTRITGNIMDNNQHGLYGYVTDHIEIKYNQIHNSGCHAIVLDQISNSDFIGNVLNGNAGQGICYLGLGNRVIGNTFQNNQGGILSYVEGNIIHHNNFIHNFCDHEDRDISINAPNVLDDGKEGNYWSSNMDPKPLTIPSVFIRDNQSNVDNHPRLTPYVFDYQAPTVDIESPVSQSSFNSYGALTLDFSTSESYTKASYSIDGNRKAALINKTIPLIGLSAGNHQLTIYAEDKFGNEGTSTISFTVNDPNSITSLFSSLSTIGILVAAIAATLIITGYWISKKGKMGAPKKRC
ncbi:MAG: NosD domain-containing protein [Candidatus Bathyarchaeia archaeon]